MDRKFLSFKKGVENREDFSKLKKVIKDYLNQPKGVSRYITGTSNFYRVILSEHLGKNVFDNLSSREYNIWKEKINKVIRELDDEYISDEENEKFARNSLAIEDSKEHGITGAREQDRSGLSSEDIKNL